MNIKLKESIASELRKLRADINITLEDLAFKSGVNKDTICRYENNSVSMNLDILYKILSVYNVELDIFFTNVNANKQKKEE